MNLTKTEVRKTVEAWLVDKFGATRNPQSVSNKDACKAIGLIPNNCKGIGTVGGGRLLKAWAEGRDVPYWASVGGYLEGGQNEAREPLVKNIKPASKPHNRAKDKKAQKAWQRKRHDFYDSSEWRELRYKALKQCGAACQCCGRPRGNGVVLHVDHIKPRSKFPHLELLLENLQVLCEDCNLGKSNKDSTDWRVNEHRAIGSEA